MLTQPQILRTPYQRAAVVRLRVPRSELAPHITLALADLIAVLADQRLTPAGSLFAHYLRITPSTFDLELGLPTDAPVRSFGRVDPGQLPASLVARAVHHGPWSHLQDAWTDLDRWLAQQPHTPALSLWERYLTDPSTVSNPADHRTELNRPIRL